MIRNPYATKKSKKQPDAATGRPSASLQPSAAPTLPVAQPATFTQAFGGLGESDDHEASTAASSAAPNVPDATTQPLPKEADNTAAIAPHQGLGNHVLYVSPRQKGNPVLEYIRNVPWEFNSNILPDFWFGNTQCALFLTVKYHTLHPLYIRERMAELKFQLTVLVVLVDTNDSTVALRQLNTLAVRHDVTLILAWSEQEAARYLETYKAYQNKNAASFLQRKSDSSQKLGDQVMDCLTAIKSVNKTDATNLITQFDSVRAIMAASPDELSLVGGLGHVKVQRLHDAFHKPFSKKAAQKRRDERLARVELKEG